MNLRNRIELLQKLKNYLLGSSPEWLEAKARATAHNGWFTTEFIDLAIQNISAHFLDAPKLEAWAAHYHLDDNINPKNIGLVMAGNIPIVGFHDFLCVFITGHKQTIKLSGKDEVLLQHLAQQLYNWNETARQFIAFAPMLKGCDAYIATGSNNSARYFEQYFAKYSNIIRSNKTSVAVLTGSETTEDLQKLADDVHIYFGMGCRNVTKLYVPQQYDFVPLLKAFDKYKHFIDHNKYKNNYDYQLALALLNNKFYMTNGTTLLIENDEIFSAISQLHYSFYTNLADLKNQLAINKEVQCVVSNYYIPFGQAQQPGLFDYADGVDTMQFMLTL